MAYSLRKDPYNNHLLNEAKKELDHRLTMLETAQGYVDYLDIGRPKNLSIYELDLAEFWYEMNKASRGSIGAKDPHYFFYAAKRFKGLFPDCNTRDFYGKPYHYVRAALTCTTTPKSQWEPRLKELIARRKKELEEERKVSARKLEEIRGMQVLA